MRANGQRTQRVKEEHAPLLLLLVSRDKVVDLADAAVGVDHRARKLGSLQNIATYIHENRIDFGTPSLPGNEEALRAETLLPTLAITGCSGAFASALN